MRLIDSNKIIDYVKGQINPYGKPFDGSVYDFGLKIMNYIDNMSTAYDIEKVVEELESFAKLAENRYKNNTSPHALQEHRCWVKAIEIVEHGGTGKDVD